MNERELFEQHSIRHYIITSNKELLKEHSPVKISNIVHAQLSRQK